MKAGIKFSKENISTTKPKIIALVPERGVFVTGSALIESYCGWFLHWNATTTRPFRNCLTTTHAWHFINKLSNIDSMPKKTISELFILLSVFRKLGEDICIEKSGILSISYWSTEGADKWQISVLTSDDKKIYNHHWNWFHNVQIWICDNKRLQKLLVLLYTNVQYPYPFSTVFPHSRLTAIP